MQGYETLDSYNANCLKCWTVYTEAHRSIPLIAEVKLMCGRYGRRSDKQKIAEHFRAAPTPAELPMPDADYNIAPTTHQPIIRQSRETGERELILARWGLVPFFTKGSEGYQGSINDQRQSGDDHESSDLA